MADETNQRQMPKRVYLHNETGKPQDSEVCDADTGEVIPGVFEVTVAHDHMDVLVTPHWPITPADRAVNNPPDADGETRQGLNVERHRYPLKRLEAESW